MKITGTSSYIKIDNFEGKSMVIEGEMIVIGFVAYKNTMTRWEVPHKNQMVTMEERDRLIKAVIEKSKKQGFAIEFE